MSLTGSESDGSFQACSQLLAGDLLLSYLPRQCLILLCSAARGALHSGRHRVVRHKHTLAHLPGVFAGQRLHRCNWTEIGSFSNGTGWLFCDFCKAAGPRPVLKPTSTPLNSPTPACPECWFALIGARLGVEERKTDRKEGEELGEVKEREEKRK